MWKKGRLKELFHGEDMGTIFDQTALKTSSSLYEGSIILSCINPSFTQSMTAIRSTGLCGALVLPLLAQFSDRKAAI